MARKIPRGLVAVLLLFLATIQSSLPYKQGSFYGVAEPYMTSIVRWEARNLLPALWQGAFTYRQTEALSRSQQVELVERYFDRKTEDSTRGQENQDPAAPDNQQVEKILAYQLSQVLKEMGLDARIGPVEVSPFPPVVFRFGRLPQILAVSPRNEIKLLDTVLLDADLTSEEVVRIEEQVERLGLSALVEGLGGVATYPSLISDTASLEFAFDTVAHEWLHQYFFFRPLGRRYWVSEEMATINETAANMVGREIGAMLYRSYFGEAGGEQATASADNYFNQELRRIRLGVDDYLARGEVEVAERFMEEGRSILAQRGYYLRRLNQAYFAFHGTYADTPASTSPIGAELRELRRRSASLTEFINRVAGLRSRQDLQRLLLSK